MKKFFRIVLRVATLNFWLLTANCLLPPVNCFSQNTRLWATYYGGPGDEFPNTSIAADAAGNVYMAGTTGMGGTPSLTGIASGGFQNTFGGGRGDAFLVKFDAAGTRLWATYYGGTGDENGYSVATDASGDVYLTGGTTSVSGIASGGFQNTLGGAYDAYLVKFDAAGIRLWATYYGGAGTDEAYGTATDAAGNVYLAGLTNSASGIASGGFQNVYGGGGYDAYLVKFSASGGRLWATYCGGGSTDEGRCVATDASANVYLAGQTASTSGIASGGFQNTISGGYDTFLVKFNSGGIRLWATYYGGTGNEVIGNIAADVSGNVFMAGFTPSVSGIASGGFQNIYGGGVWDAFLVKFNTAGNRLWATYYGGTGLEEGLGVATDAASNVYLAAMTFSTSGITLGGFQNAYGGGFGDACLVKFDASGNRLCATYYGGTVADHGFSVVSDAFGNVYLSGFTATPGSAPNAIATIGCHQPVFSGAEDAFLVKFTSCFTVLSVTATSTNILCNGQCTGTAQAAAAGGGSPSYTYAWSPGGGSASSVTGLCAGTYTVTVTDSAGGAATAVVTVTQPAMLTTTATSTATACNSNNGTAAVSASGGSPFYSYSWNPSGQTTQTATGLGAGTYTATITDANGCDTTQIVTVVSSGSVITTSQSASICTGSNYTLPGGTVVSTGGAYIDTLTSVAGCDSIITTTLTVDSALTSNQSASICSGSTYTLPGGTVVSTGGIYNDTLSSSAGCDSIIATTLTVNPNPTAGAFSNVTITQGQSATLTASGGGTYSWYPSTGLSCTACSNPTATASPLWGAGGLVYCVTVTAPNNCTDTACVTITIEPIDCSNAGELFLPNAFSPNNDGENDRLQIYYGNLKCIKNFKLVIYNRWGEKVFESTDATKQWEGAFRGKVEGTAVFVYYMKVTLITGEEIIKKGNISAIR